MKIASSPPTIKIKDRAERGQDFVSHYRGARNIAPWADVSRLCMVVWHAQTIHWIVCKIIQIFVSKKRCIQDCLHRFLDLICGRWGTWFLSFFRTPHRICSGRTTRALHFSNSCAHKKNWSYEIFRTSKFRRPFQVPGHKAKFLRKESWGISLGGRWGTWTPDLSGVNGLLYQLS